MCARRAAFGEQQEDAFRSMLDQLNDSGPEITLSHPRQPIITDRAEATQVIRRGLERCLEKERDDAQPVGICLDGRPATAILAATLKSICPDGSLYSLAAGTSHDACVETARNIAAALGIPHREHIYSDKEMLQAVPHVIARMETSDPASIHAALPCFFATRRGAEDVQLIFWGEGSDWLFGEVTDSASMNIEFMEPLNRIERMTRTCGLEGRTPFLEREFIGQVRTIDPAIRRAAFLDLLPEGIEVMMAPDHRAGEDAARFLTRMAAEEFNDDRLEPAEQESRHYARILESCVRR